MLMIERPKFGAPMAPASDQFILDCGGR
jgi:hypothetical protein